MSDKITLSLPVFPKGEVWLAGAGPGDIGLLTLHALNAIEQADVILYDALVNRSCLDYAGPQAILEFSGKRAGLPSSKQYEITARLIACARDRRRVLRLKGGDPFVFGRGGDEALALAQAQIPFRIIPGITAGIAGPAYAGIPVTNRMLNQSVTFISGHDANGQLPKNLDWHALARGAEVLVFYMAIRHIKEIIGLLLAAGRDPEDPVAFISNATTENQRVMTEKLLHAREISEKAVPAPAIVVVGKVINLRSSLAWLAEKRDNKLRKLKAALSQSGPFIF
ncbi:MAG: uroporphyrin-III C-methyltransferase [Candidatus Tokpelaia sp. JSC161]|jgi:uroporphyrin-III C-methyltransferase|nr:MAG: uroporphyrin-III C-methyltransferase [Candidatus Tokpelaia sp. JSC161]